MYRLAHIFGKTARGHPPVIYLVAPPALRQCGEKLLCYGFDFDRYFGEHAFGKPQFNVVIARFAQRRSKVYLLFIHLISVLCKRGGNICCGDRAKQPAAGTRLDFYGEFFAFEFGSEGVRRFELFRLVEGGRRFLLGYIVDFTAVACSA